MSAGVHRFDFIVIGAGIVGLSIGRELRQRFPSATIALLEKEAAPGLHASGRNSGVLHSGIYYPAGSLKARLCAAGAREMGQFCDDEKLPIRRSGKVILPLQPQDDQQLLTLLERAKSNGAQASLVNDSELREIEPEAHSCTGRALYSPQTSVVDPHAIIQRIAEQLRQAGVQFFTESPMIDANSETSTIKTSRDRFVYGHLFNAAGVFADVIAKKFGAAKDCTILPFRGSYYRLSPESGIQIRSLVYPVPDLRVPFLGVHFSRTIDNQIYLGPTAMPALGRENYSGFTGMNAGDTNSIAITMAVQFWRNTQGFRTLLRQETRRLSKANFAADAQMLVPRLKKEHLLSCDKRGIRAQLVDVRKRELVMDFLVEGMQNSTHILNAVSPAFTSSFSFAKYVLDHYVSIR